MPLFKKGDRVRFKLPRRGDGSSVSPFFSDVVAVVEEAHRTTIEGVPDAQVIYLEGSTDMWHSWDLEPAPAAGEWARRIAMAEVLLEPEPPPEPGIPIRRRLNLRRPE